MLTDFFKDLSRFPEIFLSSVPMISHQRKDVSNGGA